jgi:kumamolisin
VALTLAITTTGLAATPGQGHPGYEPAQIIGAYDFGPLYRQGLTGAGQTIALIEVDGVDPRDVTHFDQRFGLPAADLAVYVPSGTSQALPPGPETTLDVEWAHALAPAAHLRVYEVTQVGDFTNYAGHLSDAIRAAYGAGAAIISLSLRGTGSIVCSTGWSALHLHQTFKEAVSRHVAVFAASGDYGGQPCPSRHTKGTVYPASDPDVTAVGGTALHLGPHDAYGGETAWSGSGGGYSADFLRPSYQHGPGAYNLLFRGVPDVAFDADPSSGVLVYLQGQWGVVGGTSVGAPCWAALWALASQYHQQRTHGPLGFANPLLYALGRSSQYGHVFHDVTGGSNGYESAGVGYDEVTGLGSPDADRLVRALTP